MSVSLQTLFIGRKLFSFEEISSTNIILQEQALAMSLPEGTAMVTKRQLNGRGQMGTQWESENNGNLYCSVLLNPLFLEISEQFKLSICIATACINAVNEVLGSNEAKIKWPNDIILHKKKLGGILIENTLRGKALQQSIIGIGMNVNQNSFSVDLPNAISLKNASGKEYTTTNILNTLLNCIEAQYLILKSGNFKRLETQYLENLMGLNKIQTLTEANGLQFKGEICGIDLSGKLIVHCHDRKQDLLYGLKEITQDLASM